MGSISQWIGELKEGNDDAARLLWERFYTRLVTVARSKLREFPRRFRDEEDFALSAFDRLCRAARAGKYPRLDDRSQLWKLLIDITEKRVIDYKRHETCPMRGGGKNIDEGGLPAGIDALADNALSAEYLTTFDDTFGNLLARLPDERQRVIAIHKMEGLTNSEIAEELGCPLRTVERKLSIIRKAWQEELNA